MGEGEGLVEATPRGDRDTEGDLDGVGLGLGVGSDSRPMLQNRLAFAASSGLYRSAPVKGLVLGASVMDISWLVAASGKVASSTACPLVDVMASTDVLVSA